MNFRITYLLFFAIVLLSCNKGKFLEKRSDQSLSIPASLKDYQAILDNDGIMNGFRDNSGIDPNFLIAAADDYYMPESEWVNIPITEIRNQYVWNDDIYGLGFTNWDRLYFAIFHTNVVLNGIDKLELNLTDRKIRESYNQAKGSALFFRSRFFYQLAQVFAPPYREQSADSELGIIMRFEADINENLKGSTIRETYSQIISDLKLASSLLPEFSSSQYKNRPSKAAALAMLAKTFLLMGDYTQAYLYADSCLKIQSDLIDYNSLNYSLPFVINRDNPEIIFYSMVNVDQAILITPVIARIDSSLYQSYDENDLRKTAFFQPALTPVSSKDVIFRGSYDGYFSYFTGIAVDEILLIRAEANARIGNLVDALSDLNSLLRTRWKNDGSFIPLFSSDKEKVLELILGERRKELVQRGTRWSDLRRLNLEGAAIEIVRFLDGKKYELKPNDLRYTFLIPPDVIAFHPDMVQNKR